MEFLAAICQRPPALLDTAASMAAALAAIAEAASKGVRLITFPEAFLPGYPTWIWRLRPGADMALGNEIHRQLQLNAIAIVIQTEIPNRHRLGCDVVTSPDMDRDT